MASPTEKYLYAVAGDPYSPDTCYMIAADERGHSQHVTCRVPVNIPGEIAAVVQTGKLPYRSTSDFIRDAIIHRLHWAVNKVDDPAILTGVHQMMLTVEIARTKEMVDEAEKIVMGLRETIARAVKLGFRIESIGKWREMANGMVEPFRSQASELLADYEANHVSD